MSPKPSTPWAPRPGQGTTFSFPGPEFAQHHPGDTSLPATLVDEERNALRRFSPRRSRWPELAEYDRRLAEVDARATALSARTGELAGQADESTKLAASWIRDERLETAFPNPPKITSGKVMTHKNGVTA